MAKMEEQFEKLETMRKEAEKKRREDRRLNLFWRRNKTFPTQYGGEEETQDVDETLMFWRVINNKTAGEGWRDDESVQDALQEVREKHQGRRCRWGKFTEGEFDEVLRCTSP